MGLVVLKDGLLIFKVFGLAYFLVLHGSAGLSPDGGETPVPESQRTSAISPIMAETPQKVFLQPPQSSPPISSALSHGRVNDPIVPALPPSIDFSPPVNASDNSTVLAPSAPPGNPKHSDPIPETPAPFPLPSTNSPNNSYISPGLSPAGSLSPPSPAPFPLPSTNSPNNSSISPGLPPAGSLSPPSPDAASTIPPALPPVNSVVPELSPPISPVPKALPPRMPPIALPENPLHIQPPLPAAKPPPILSGPAVSPVPSQERVGLPPQATAPPRHEIIRNESTTNGSHINAPAPEAVIVPSVNLPPPPSKSPMGPTSSTSEPPPTSVVWHRYEKNNRSSPSPQLYTGSPPTSHEQDPKINKSFHGPPPLKPVSSIPPYVSASPPSTRQYYSPPPSPSLVPPVSFISPKTSPSGSSPRIPKFRQPSFQALPPPPPNEGCTSFTCTDPLTIGPPGTPCVCVLPMQVALRLSVAVYTFFPLVSELATEIANGVFFKPSQVRIMGANVADEDSEKTTVLLDLVPLSESFDNATSYLIFRRFWHKELVINDSLFGNYEVLYVRYPGLPPSPPVGVDFENSDPYYGHGNGAAVKPLGVDVPRTTRRGGPSKSVIAIIILSSSLAVIFGSVIAWFLVFRRRDHLSEPESTPPVNLPSSAKSAGMGISAFGSPHSSASMSLPSSIAIFTGSAKTFTSIEMERATENFSESRIIGEGGFGLVYKGMLDDEKQVAVKVLKRADQQGSREFLAEVEMLSRLHHRNLVKLIGICIEERAHCLVYELIPNGSVESHLHGIHKESSPLDWNSRLKIALGAARGLAYLHEDSSPRVIHRDFKSSNILLEQDFTPKVSDFGLARTALEEENKHISTRVMGTFGYVAPEYAMTGHLLVKSDVYSYGVVLLELLTGRKPVDMSQPSGQENLVSWARPLLTSEEGLESIIDSSLGPGFPYDSISKVAAIASMCVQPEVSHRPFMGEVVQALKLVCNECDETTELGSTGFSHEDVVALDVDARISGYLHHPIRSRSQTSGYDSGVDVERGHSGSYLLDSSVRYTRQDSGSIERYSSSSGPLRTGKTKRLWQKVSLLSGGSFSDHSLMFNSWRRSL